MRSDARRRVPSTARTSGAFENPSTERAHSLLVGPAGRPAGAAQLRAGVQRAARAPAQRMARETRATMADGASARSILRWWTSPTHSVQRSRDLAAAAEGCAPSSRAGAGQAARPPARATASRPGDAPSIERRRRQRRRHRLRSCWRSPRDDRRPRRAVPRLVKYASRRDHVPRPPNSPGRQGGSSRLVPLLHEHGRSPEMKPAAGCVSGDRWEALTTERRSVKSLIRGCVRRAQETTPPCGTEDTTG